MALTTKVVIRYDSNASKLAADAKKAAAAQKQLAGATRKTFSALDAHNARITNARENTAKYNAKLAAFDAAAKRARGSQKQLNAEVKNAGGSFATTATQAGIYVAAIVGAAHTVDELSQRTLQLTDVQRNLPFSIDKATKASKGLVDQYTLQQKAVLANTLGAVSTAEEYEKLVAIATKLARAQGIDAAEGVDKLTVALARGSFLRADDLGISLTATKAYEMYADEIGVTVQQLTDAQKAEAKRFAILQKGIDAAENMTLSEGGLALAIQKSKIEIIDGADAALRFADGLTKAAEESDAVTGFMDAVNTVAPFATTNILDAADAFKVLDEAINSDTFRRGGAALQDFAAGARKAALAPLDARRARIDTERAEAANEASLALAMANFEDLGPAKEFDIFGREIKKKGKRGRKQSLEKIDLDAIAKFQRDADNTLNELREQTAAIESIGDISGRARTSDEIAKSDADFEVMRAQSEKANEFAVEQAELKREMQLEQLEIDEAMGLTPQAQAAREAEIARDHLDEMLELHRNHQVGKREVEKAAHEAKLAELKAEQVAERERMKSIKKGFGEFRGVMQNTMEISTLVADATGASAERQARIANRFKGVQVLGTAVQETVEAIAAAARYDFGSAALHGSAAALGFIKGPLLLSGALDPSGGGGGGGEAPSPFAAPSGPSRPGAGDSGSQSRELPSGPISRPGDPQRTPPPQGGQNTAPTSGGNKTTVVNIENLNSVGRIDEDAALNIRQAIDDNANTVGNA